MLQLIPHSLGQFQISSGGGIQQHVSSCGIGRDMGDVAQGILLGIVKILEQDPRPHYHNDPERVYGMPFLDLDIRFKVEKSVLKIVEIIKK